ncbi:L-aspartate oxidase [Solicola sp. PLA-1-18]|uniref:L-aspartate oxidase n=1 Tax=Solicola sp. PLA-1-18 TaxID=3380532 RepID=UPI003B7C52DC
MRVLVVGSGIAGLTCALEAAAHHDVTVVTKAGVADGATRWAQGGVAVVWDADGAGGDDTVASHVADTLAAGDGLCDPTAVEVLCAEGPSAVAGLVRRGVDFDRDGAAYARGTEAAHSAARVLHAGGDATGAAIELALVEALRRSGVEVVEHTAVADLVVRDGAVVGVRTDRGDELSADAVVLATGGAGQLYPFTTNPSVATGDGLAAALRAGAVVGDLEMYQFHPTMLAVPGGALISEAVRGEGAVLRDARGSRFMTAVDPRAELAPRDVVARAIARTMAEQGGAPVVLDATALGAEHLARRFPGLTAQCASHGLDWAREPVPVAPAAHYWMGGVRTDLDGRTSLPGLLAVGEVARTGVHGANRLASSSLLEGAVFGTRCARALDEPWREPDVVDVEVVALGGGDEPLTREALQDVMWTGAGLVRDADGLAAAAAVLDGAVAASDHLEDHNLLDLGRALVAGATLREESRGAHHRSDAPGHTVGAARPTYLVAKDVAPC